MGLFAFLGGGRRLRARDELLTALNGGAVDALRALAGLKPADQIVVLQGALRLLMLDDRHREAEQVLAALGALDPVLAMEPAIELATATGRTALAMELCQAQLVRQPGDVSRRGWLAALLVAEGQAAEALGVLDAGSADDPHLGVVRVDALVALDRLEPARVLAAAIRDRAESELKHTLNSGTYEEWRQLVREASARYDHLTAQLEGAEAVMVHALKRGHLDARAGVNYLLMAQAAMVASPPLARRLDLQAAELDRAEAQQALAINKRDVAALCQRAGADLRLGQVDTAERAFRQARELQGDFFPALLGLAAVLDERRYQGRAAARALRPGTPAECASVVCDWPALTAEERTVVQASVGPLAAALPAMAAAGATIRLLPIDVRPTDLPELAALEDEEEEDDHRAVTAIGGLATHRLAVARILELIDTVTEHSWVFAHEFGHMAFWYLPEAVQTAVEALYQRALSHPHTCGQYQLKNIDEFFAVSYQHFLLHRHRRRAAPELDEEGVAQGMFAVFERVERSSASAAGLL